MTRNDYKELADIFFECREVFLSEMDFQIFIEKFSDEMFIRHSSFKKDRFIKYCLKPSNGQSAIPADGNTEINS